MPACLPWQLKSFVSLLLEWNISYHLKTVFPLSRVKFTVTGCGFERDWRKINPIYNAMQWINWLGGRWRTQLAARRHVNCRTHEHRHFERILRVCSCSRPTLVSGSVLHPSASLCVCAVHTHTLAALSGLWLQNQSRIKVRPAAGYCARQAFDAQGLPASCVLYCYLCPGLCRFSCPGGLLVQLSIASAKPKLGPSWGLSVFFFQNCQLANLTTFSTWHQGRLPAEFKHINKRRKRKQQWFP